MVSKGSGMGVAKSTSFLCGSNFDRGTNEVVGGQPLDQMGSKVNIEPTFEKLAKGGVVDMKGRNKLVGD